MRKVVVVVDVREDFLAEVADCCRSLDAEVVQVVDAKTLKDHTLVMTELVVAVWADLPASGGVNIPQAIMRAIAASRWHIPVILYGAQRATLTGLLEPGMQCPHVVVSAHACSVAGTIQRVLRQLGTLQDQDRAFEDWACENMVPLATSPGEVCVYISYGNGGFASLADPQNPLGAVACLLESSDTANAVIPNFY